MSGLVALMLLALALIPAVTGSSSDDLDGDGVPDTFEARLCGSAAARDVLSDIEAGGSCPTSLDYVPDTSVTISVPDRLEAGTDADGDGLPGTVHYKHRVYTVDRHAMTASERLLWDVQSTFDPHDGDASIPPMAIWCEPLGELTGASAPVDGDADGYPQYTSVTSGEVCLDRRGSTGLKLHAAAGVRSLPVDPDDGSVEEPGENGWAQTEYVFLRGNFSADADGDTLVHLAFLYGGFVTFMFEKPGVPMLTPFGMWWPWDRMDDNAAVPAPVHAADLDGDGISDAVESYICLVEERSTEHDGYCPTLADYVPPLNYFGG